MNLQWLFTGIACLALAGSVSGVEPTTVSEINKGKRMMIEVRNDWYRLRLDPDQAGRIVSLVPTGSETELADRGLAIGAITRTDLGGGLDLQLRHTVKKLPGGLEVILASGVENRELLGGTQYTKTFLFRDDSPFIQLRTEVTNHGAGAIVAWRLYSDIAVSRDLKAVVFQEGARAGEVTGPAAWAENNPAQARAWKIWDRAGSGWVGVSTGLGQECRFLPDGRLGCCLPFGFRKRSSNGQGVGRMHR